MTEERWPLDNDESTRELAHEIVLGLIQARTRWRTGHGRKAQSDYHRLL